MFTLFMRAGRRLWAAALLPVLAAPAGASVNYVKADATGANNGTSWADAYVYLQDAIAASVSGDEIWVAAGVYTPDMGAGIMPLDVTRSFQLRDGVAWYGGFNGTEVQREERDWESNVTTLSGDLLKDDGPNFANRADNSRNVVKDVPGVEAVVALDGFTISGGYASEGGGLKTSRADVTVANCTFSANWAARGGAVHDAGVRSRFTDCRFVGNAAEWEAGAVVPASNSQFFERCDFIGNTANMGGALALYASARSTYRDCRFVGNHAVSDGGTISSAVNTSAANEFVNCVFTGNESDLRGGVASMMSMANLRFLNCTLSNNRSGSPGAAIYYESSEWDPSYLQVANSILFGNVDNGGPGNSTQIHVLGDTPGLLDVTYSCVERGFAGVGNIALEPQFANPNGADGLPGTEDDDLTLGAASPCIDAGNSARVPPDVVTDLAGNPRIVDAAAPDTGAPPPPMVDMGAYESPGLGFVIAGRPVVVPEGGAAEFSVALATDPGGPLTVTAAFHAGDADISVQSGGTLSFDSQNYAIPQPVTLVAAQDEDGGPGVATFVVSAAGLPNTYLDATEIDDDQRCVLSGVPLHVPEGGQAAFNVALERDPVVPLTVMVRRAAGPGMDDDLRPAGDVSGVQLEFESGNYQVPQPVGVLALPDADAVNGWAQFRVDAVETPTAYADAYEVDADTYFVIGGAPVSVPEGGTGIFTVRLAARPAEAIIVNVAWQPGDPDLSVLAGQSLTFTPANATTPQPVTLAAAQDSDDQNGQAVFAVTSANWTTSQAIGNEVDDDHRLIVEPRAVDVPEGATATFSVQLAGAPAGPIQVSVVRISGDADLSVASGGLLTFDAGNYATPQDVTLAAARDADHVNGVAAFDVRAATYASVGVSATEIELGDVNCDGRVDFFDIDAFLLALFDPGSYPQVYPDCVISMADLNSDGFVDNFDIDPFIAVLFNR